MPRAGREGRWWAAAVVAFVVAAASVAMSSAATQRMGISSLLRGWDAQFYYAAARSLMYQGDLDVSDDLLLSPGVRDFDRDGDGVLEVPAKDSRGRVINKYPIGLSLLEVPWLAASGAIRRLPGLEPGGESAAPGYSASEVLFTATGLVWLVILGLLLLYRVANEYAPPAWATAAVLATVACTPLLYYSTITPFMSHGPAMALVVAIVYVLQRIEHDRIVTDRQLVAVAALAALLFLVRPQQVLLIGLAAPIFLPVLRKHSRWQRRLVVPAVLFSLAPLLMLAVNWSQGGRLTLNAYAAAGEGFSWLSPAFYRVLLSADRGLIWMSPIVLVAILGYFRPPVREYRVPWIVLAHGVLQLYLIMTWSSPDQGDSFGARMWIESLPAVTIGLAFLLTGLGRAGRVTVLAVVAVFAAWNAGLMLAKRDLGASHLQVAGHVIRRLKIEAPRRSDGEDPRRGQQQPSPRIVLPK